MFLKKKKKIKNLELCEKIKMIFFYLNKRKKIVFN